MDYNVPVFGVFVMRYINVILILVIIYLGHTLVHGPNGLRRYQQVTAELRQAKEYTKSLEERNMMMKIDIESLKKTEGSGTVENLARSNLGMIKSGEVFYRVIFPNRQEVSEHK